MMLLKSIGEMSANANHQRTRESRDARFAVPVRQNKADEPEPELAYSKWWPCSRPGYPRSLRAAKTFPRVINASDRRLFLATRQETTPIRHTFSAHDCSVPMLDSSCLDDSLTSIRDCNTRIATTKSRLYVASPTMNQKNHCVTT